MNPRWLPMMAVSTAVTIAMQIATPADAQSAGIQSSDLFKMRSIGDVQVSPDGTRAAYVVQNNDQPGRPYSQIWVVNLADGQSSRFGGEREPSSGPEWSPDGQWIAYEGREAEKPALVIARPDGTQPKVLFSPLAGTNSPLPLTGKRFAWSPDSNSVAFVSATPGPETEEASGDPVVITRYLYKPDLEEGSSHFNDNRRLHIFVAELSSGQIRQLTHGDYYEHSIDWSPNGEEILFVSNREPDQDRFFNYDLFALKVSDGSIRRLTATENAEYRPRWSPDGKSIVYLGTRRGLTDLETAMEDTHVWLMDADGGNRRELGQNIDDRQGTPGWAGDGSAVYFTVMERGNVRLYRVPAGGGTPEAVVNERGSVGAWSVTADNSVAYAFAGPADSAQLYWKAEKGSGRKLTDLNAGILRDKQIAEVDSFTFESNDNKFAVEAFLTKPLGMTAASKHPLIVVIHGGPHGQQGPAFNLANQVYAAQGWATLMVNYRGSTGYGQKFTDAIFADQNGNEAQDVLYGLSAALRRNPWIDRDRLGIEGGSYGGQLSGWLITQTSIFKAAIPSRAIFNLISYNYMTYYNQYEQMEWGLFPHQGNMMDVLWERSALKHVAKVKTPVMLIHGENDSDVPIAESEQFYVALKDVGVETVMVRYPREGHGLREPRHVVDSIDRSIQWYVKHFPAGAPGSTTAIGRPAE
jgi:dipeptidyl aminopeptidase/acylaminoacyl peptidase